MCALPLKKGATGLDNKFDRETNIVVYSGKVTDSVEGRCADDREHTQHTNCSKGANWYLFGKMQKFMSASSLQMSV